MNSSAVAGALRVLSDLPTEAGGALLEHMFDLVAVVGLPDLSLHYVNASGRRLLQIGSHDPLAGATWTEFVSAGTRQAMSVHGSRAITAGRSWRGAGFLRARTGTELPVRLGMTGVTGDPEAGPLALITALDDARTHHLQTALRNEQLLLHAMVNSVPDAIYFKDRESRFIRASAALARKLGVAGPEDLIGRTDADFFPVEAAEKSRAEEQRIIATREPMLDAEEKEVRPDGSETWVSTSKFPLRDWRGNLVGTFGITRDVSARKRAEKERRHIEEQLFLAQKMESIGRLAAGIAHEINTPTQYITDNTHFLIGAFRQLTSVCTAHQALRARACAHPDLHAEIEAVCAAESEAEFDYLLNEIPRTLEQTIEGLSRVARIVHSLREFAHPGKPDKAPTNLNQAAETAIAVSRHEWKLVADAVTDLDPDLPLIPCVVDEINQVLLNLIVNAAHAIEDAVAKGGTERGCITLRTRREGDWALLEVEDTGAGIEEPVRRHIFEPFFTTKPVGRGTGQGLALVHTMIVKNHHGSIAFTSEVGRGTTFHIRLPINPPADVPADADAPIPLP